MIHGSVLHKIPFFAKEALWAAIVALSWWCSSEAQAGTISFTVPTINLTASAQPQSGFFDVLVSDTATTDQVDGFVVDVSNTNTTQLQLTSATLNTTSMTGLYGSSAAYIGTTSAWGTNTSPFYYAQFNPAISNPVVPANYEAFNVDSPATTPGPALTQTYALLQVGFTVAGGATGTFPLTLTPNVTVNGVNAYPTGNYNYIDIQSGSSYIEVAPTLLSGSINITAAPEPSAWVLSAFAAAGCGCYKCRRRGRRSNVK